MAAAVKSAGAESGAVHHDPRFVECAREVDLRRYQGDERGGEHVDVGVVGQFEALDDLGRTLSEMYFYLSGSEKSGTLGDSLIQQFGALKTFVALRQSSPVAA